MTVTQIYDRYHIPINLQEHMLRVAAVGQLVCESLRFVEFRQDRVLTVLLLHDMGNILKFKFERVELFAPEDQDRVAEMQKIQQEFREKYGETPDEATLAIMREIGVDEKAVDLCHRSHGERLEAIVADDDWEEKVCFYADMRVGPFGVLSVEDRFADLVVRYPHNEKRIGVQLSLSQKLERQLQARSSHPLSALDDDAVEPLLPLLKQRVIH